MTAKPILVVGATGRTGRRVVEQPTVLGIPVRAASRSAQQCFGLDGTPAGPAILEPAGTSDVERVFAESAVTESAVTGSAVTEGAWRR